MVSAWNLNIYATPLKIFQNRVAGTSSVQSARNSQFFHYSHGRLGGRCCLPRTKPSLALRLKILMVLSESQSCRGRDHGPVSTISVQTPDHIVPLRTQGDSLEPFHKNFTAANQSWSEAVKFRGNCDGVSGVVGKAGQVHHHCHAALFINFMVSLSPLPAVPGPALHLLLAVITVINQKIAAGAGSIVDMAGAGAAPPALWSAWCVVYLKAYSPECGEPSMSGPDHHHHHQHRQI